MEPRTFQRAAQYLRMSTDQQQYSTENQAAAIQAYAALRGLEVIATYKDEGKSGLHVEGRAGLLSLLRDVEAGQCLFNVIVVYDVSRWGRFQDTDESAYYEYLCRRAGIAVEYCAEQFQNDGSSLSTIMKSIKRAMAAEYSRELSTKVFFGQKRLVQKGFLLGGSPGYGFRRQIIDASGVPKTNLTHGQQKVIRGDRVIMVAGPQEEVETVNWIYQQYLGGAYALHIAGELQRRGVLTEKGNRFTVNRVHSVLTSERYIGVNVWNKHSTKLGTRRVRNSPDTWIRYRGAFPALIDEKTFAAAQAERQRRLVSLTDEEMLAPLRMLLKKHGKLTVGLINKTKGIPLHTGYTFRFGSMRRTYELVGYNAAKDCSYADRKQQLREPLAGAVDQIVDGLIASGVPVERTVWNRATVDKDCRLMVTLARFRKTRDQKLGWHVPPTKVQTDIFVIARPDDSGAAIKDYFVVPHGLLSALQFNLTEYKAGALALDYHSCNAAGLAEKVEMVSNELARRIQYRLRGYERNLTIELDVRPPSLSAR